MESTHPDMEAAVEEPAREMLSWYAILVRASAAPVARPRAPNTAEDTSKNLLRQRT